MCVSYEYNTCKSKNYFKKIQNEVYIRIIYEVHKDTRVQLESISKPIQ